MTPRRLAKELGVGQIEMYGAMQELRLHVKRMQARLSTKEETALRQHFTNTRRRRQPRPMPASASSSSPQVASRVPVLREFPRTCPCCDRRWIHMGEVDQAATLCANCIDHYAVAGEGIERRLARAESHAALYKEDRDIAHAKAQKNYDLRAAAFESRAKWKAALAEVVLDHEEGPDGHCWCGHAMPCRSWRTLHEANRGIHRQVETWASWSDERLEEFLYGEDRASRLVLDEDETDHDTGDLGSSISKPPIDPAPQSRAT